LTFHRNRFGNASVFTLANVQCFTTTSHPRKMVTMANRDYSHATPPTPNSVL
jgi:hypothetical protein